MVSLTIEEKNETAISIFKAILSSYIFHQSIDLKKEWEWREKKK